MPNMSRCQAIMSSAKAFVLDVEGHKVIAQRGARQACFVAPALIRYVLCWLQPLGENVWHRNVCVGMFAKVSSGGVQWLSRFVFLCFFKAGRMSVARFERCGRKSV